MSLWAKIKAFVNGPLLPDDYWTSRTVNELLDHVRGRDNVLSARAARELNKRFSDNGQSNPS